MSLFITTMLDQLGSTIRRIRNEREISQQCLADSAGVTASFLSLIECGHRSPSLRVIERIARALELSHEALLWESVTLPNDLSKADRELCEIAKSIVKRTLNVQTLQETDPKSD